jgi:hypothetical protein
MAAVTPGGWGLNVGGFIDAHPGWLIRGRASGYTAQRKDKDGRPRGLVLEARTLDELAALIEAAGQS